MSRPSDKQKSNEQRAIEWYKLDIKDYNKKIIKYSKLIRNAQERIEALETKEREKNDTTRELLTES
tara:strand:+ start:693 stop:890 length:198 start_codon:yes stop_codon:yes gene_type:complete